jgi:calcineurin-like phosphoesterase
VGKGRSMLNAIMVEVDERTGKASRIERIYREAD